MKVKRVVIPVAGWGTRALPATKNVPKEMLPVLNKPVVQYVVEEAQAAGLVNVVFVTNRTKTIIEDHFDSNPALENALERAGNVEQLAEVRRVAEMANIVSVRQKEQRGLGHAVQCARDVVGSEPFAVMVGDDIMHGRESAIQQLLNVASTENMAVVGVVEVPANRVDRYGIIDAEEFAPSLYRVRGLVEKPAPGSAPSRLAMVGRYVLLPEIFEHLDRTKPDARGEIQLTDALQGLAKNNKLLAVKLKGDHYDTGYWLEYLAANVHLALEDPALKKELAKSLREWLALAER